jgi:hypothetical protein
LQIQEQSKNAMGDVNKTFNSTANRMKRVGERWKELQEQGGKFLIQGLQIDNVLEGLSKGMHFLSENAHNVAFAINGITSQLAGFIAKATIVVGGELKEFGQAFDVLRAKISGDDREVKRIRNQVKQERLVRKAQIDSIEKYTVKKHKEAFQEWNKIENTKKKITKQNVDDAIKTAIEKTKDLIPSDTKTSTQRTQQQQSQVSALEKGSLEAVEIEKQSTGNKTEVKQLKEAQKQTKELKNISSNQNRDTEGDF